MWFFIIFIATAGLLAALGLLPSELMVKSDGKTLSEQISGGIAEKITGEKNGDGVTVNNGNNSSSNNGDSKTDITSGSTPSRLVIPRIKLDTTVYTPKNTEVEVLDQSLVKGPVYYPGSGTTAGGNMFIFGHSTGYKVVINQAYKVFNELHTLIPGDVIYIVADGKTYTYRVRAVDKVNKDETLVEFDTKNHLLTLSTCNSFGAKTDRYVVTADFVN